MSHDMQQGSRELSDTMYQYGRVYIERGWQLYDQGMDTTQEAITGSSPLSLLRNTYVMCNTALHDVIITVELPRQWPPLSIKGEANEWPSGHWQRQKYPHPERGDSKWRSHTRVIIAKACIYRILFSGLNTIKCHKNTVHWNRTHCPLHYLEPPH